MEVALEVDGKAGQAGAFVEVDFATMDQPRLRAKVARHRDYASDRAWWDRHPGCPALLLLTTSEARFTRFLANSEKDRPRQNRYDGEDHEFDWDELVREWTLAKEGVTDRRVAEADAAAHYEARRQAAVADHLRQLPLHRRVVASEAAVAADYDARHLVICTDCGIARHERDDPYDFQHDSCPACGGSLVSAVQQPDVLPSLAESIATIRVLLADLDGGR